MILVPVLAATITAAAQAAFDRSDIAPEAFAFIAALAAIFGLLAGLIGFAIMFLLRQIQIWRFRAASVIVAIALDLAIFAFVSHGDVDGWRFSPRMFVFPLIPLALSTIFFERLSLRYIRLPRLTHH